MKELKVRLTFTDELLGSQPGNPDIHREFIASKAPDAITREEEIAAIGVDEEIDKMMTVFYRVDGKPCLKGYQIIGFLKEAARAYYGLTPKEIEDICGKKLAKLPAYKTKINQYIKVHNLDGGDFIPINLKEGTSIGSLQRPLRGQTAQGERISLANSETVAAGSTIEMKIRTRKDDLTDYIEGWLAYGEEDLGLLQWRSSGKGRFKWEKIGDWE